MAERSRVRRAVLPTTSGGPAIYLISANYWEAVCDCGWLSALWHTKLQADVSAARHDYERERTRG